MYLAEVIIVNKLYFNMSIYIHKMYSEMQLRREKGECDA